LTLVTDKVRIVFEVRTRGFSLKFGDLNSTLIYNFAIRYLTRDISVAVVNRLRTRWSWKRSIPDRGSRFFACCKSSSLALGLTSVLWNGYWVTFLGVKRPGREPDSPLPSGVEVNEEWGCIYSPPYTFVAHTGTTSKLQLAVVV